MNISIENKLQTLQSPQVGQKEAVVPAAENTAADIEVQKSVSVTNKTDRIEISAQGRAVLSQSAVVSANEAQSVEQQAVQQAAQTAETVNAQGQQTAQAGDAQQETQLQAAKLDASGQKAALGMAQGAPAQTDEEESATVLAEATDTKTASDEAVIASAESASTTNLTSLSEQQIKDLVSDGTISQAEANTELARRAAAQQQMQQAQEQTQGDPVEEAAGVDAKAADAVESRNNPQQQAAQMYTQMQQNEGGALFSAVA